MVERQFATIERQTVFLLKLMRDTAEVTEMRRLSDRQFLDKQTDSWVGRTTRRQTVRHTEIIPNRLTGRQTDRQTQQIK